ncbi:right-handed parallel beta-helix repeat-containing protein [Candidatus Sumerlaeota bacterium]|nr:right-handed parallel beta-helix repeat-containing protein [Candidatus Sumerlaeota bacterium]
MKKAILFISCMVLISIQAFAQYGIRVPEDYIKIDDAVQAAQVGEDVLISPGVYDRNYQDFPIVIKPGVIIKGNGYARTFIDSGGTGAPAFLAQNVNSSDTLIMDLTIRNGNLGTSGGSALFVTDTQGLYLINVRFLKNTGTNGGAVYINNSRIFFRDCLFEGNRGDFGGAVFIDGAASAPLFSQNTFNDNTSLQSGGAIYIWDGSGTEISRNAFTGNQAALSGGAVMIENCSPNFLDNLLEENQASNGGALALVNSSSEIQRNRFLKNRADAGGGIYSNAASAVILQNSFSYNEAFIQGVGYAASGSSDDFLNNALDHNRCAAASGSAASITNSTVNFVQNTVSHNQCDAGLGLFNSSIAVFNNIFSFNAGAGIYEYDPASDPDCQYNLFYDNAAANYMDEAVIALNSAGQINSANNAPQISLMNIVSDPLFRDADMGDYHVKPSSPVRESGTFFPPSFPEQDMDGEIRRMVYSGSNTDIGADEITFPRLIGPVIMYDLDDDRLPSEGDEIILTFNRAMDAPTTLTAADFYLPVNFNTLGAGATGKVSSANPRQVVITLGTSPYLTIDGAYSDANLAPGSPSGIDVALSGPGGLADEDSEPASPLGYAPAPSTGIDIEMALDSSTQYVGWYSSAFFSPLTGHYKATLFDVPILTSYYDGWLTMRQPLDYVGATNAIAFEGTFSMFIFDPFNPPTLTMKYSENEIDPSKGEREENMRIFRLNRWNPDRLFFELVPGCLGSPQVVDTLNNTVSVTITYLYPPRNAPYTPALTLPFDLPLTDESKGIYAVFPVKPIQSVQKTVRAGSESDIVELAAANADPYFSHEAFVRGFIEDTSGTIHLTLRSPRPNERELFPEKSNAVFVVEATELDDVTPVDVSSTITALLGYKDPFDGVFQDDVVDEDGVKGSKSQLDFYCVNPDSWELETASGTGFFNNTMSNLLIDDISPAHFHSGRAVIGTRASSNRPFAWNFFFNEEDWKFYSLFDGFDPCVPGNGYNFLSIAGHSHTSFSFWASNPDELPVVERCVYRARIPVETDVYSQSQCPSFRIRVNSQNGHYYPMMKIMSPLEGYAAPAEDFPKLYDFYFIPPNSAVDAPFDQDDLEFNFDYINLDTTDAKDATLFFKGVQIDRIPMDSLTSTATLATYTFNSGAEGWQQHHAYPFFTPPIFSSTGPYLYLGVADQNTYGYWETDTEVPITTDTLYCARFFIYSDIMNRQRTPDIRLRVTTKSFMQVAKLRIGNMGTADMSPIRIPREYAVYFYPEQELLMAQLRETIVLSVDLINLSSKGQLGGGIYVDTVILESYDPPPLPY